MSEIDLDTEEKFIIKSFNFLTLKPMLYVYNVDEDEVNDHSDNGIAICAK